MSSFFKGHSVRNWTSLIPLSLLVLQIISIIHHNVPSGEIVFGLFFLFFFVLAVNWGEVHSAGCAKAIATSTTIITLILTFFIYDNNSDIIFTTIPFTGCFVSAFSAGICSSIYRKIHNEKWYRTTYPHCITQRKKDNHKHGKTRIACYHCNSGYLKGYNMMNKTFTRRMYCGDCGTTLFYAPEGR